MGSDGKVSQPADRLEFYLEASEAIDFLRQVAWVLTGIREGRKEGGRQKRDPRHAQPFPCSHDPCNRWCCAHLMDKRTSLRRGTAFLSLVYIPLYPFLGIYIPYLPYSIISPFFFNLDEWYFYSTVYLMFCF